MATYTLDDIISTLKSLDELAGIDGVGYSLQVVKMVDSDKLGVSAHVNIQALQDNSKKYIECIQKCHKKIEDIGLENIQLMTKNNTEGYANAVIMAHNYQ